MSAEVSWTRCSIWKITVTCGALLAWYQQLFRKVLQATFLTFVKPTSMAYFVQFDPAMNKCIFVSTRNRTSKEGDVSSVVYQWQHLMDHLLKDFVEKVYPVGSRAKKCIFVLLANINVQSSFRWITITIQTLVCRSVRKLYWIIAWLSSLEMQRASATKRPRCYIVD